MGIHGLPVGSGMIEIRRRLSANTEKGREMEVRLTATGESAQLLSDVQDRHAGPDMDGADEYLGNADGDGEASHFCGDPWPGPSSSCLCFFDLTS